MTICQQISSLYHIMYSYIIIRGTFCIFWNFLLEKETAIGYTVFTVSNIINRQVSYIGSTPASQAGRVGSTPITCSDMKLNKIPQVQPYTPAGFYIVQKYKKYSDIYL